jgi:hypothetical protein
MHPCSARSTVHVELVGVTILNDNADKFPGCSFTNWRLYNLRSLQNVSKRKQNSVAAALVLAENFSQEAQSVAKKQLTLFPSPSHSSVD